MSPYPPVGTLVVGGGPAGLAVLLSASRGDQLQWLLRRGLVVLERGHAMGAGRLSRYGINSDSAAETFLSAVVGHPEPSIAALANHPIARQVAAYGRDAIPLRLAASLLDLLGAAMGRLLAARSSQPVPAVLTEHDAQQVQRHRDGWLVRSRCLKSGAAMEIVARSVLLAAGGCTAGHEAAVIAGRPLAGLGDRLVHSEQILAAADLPPILNRLRAVAKPTIVVIGASASAMSCVRVLLQQLGATLGPGALVLMHRRRLLPWYRSVEDARADGYTDFGADDVCPLSGMVHRFGGLRFDSRELVRGALGLGGVELDKRVRLHQLGGIGAVETGCPGTTSRRDTRQLLDRADLVVSATGYQPFRLPILDETGAAIPLLADRPGMRLVGDGAGVLGADGREIEGLYGLGLASGFRPGPELGGEPSFHGQVNGLWLWQNDVGRMVASRLVDAAARRPMPQVEAAA